MQNCDRSLIQKLIIQKIWSNGVAVVRFQDLQNIEKHTEHTKAANGALKDYLHY